MTDKERKLNEIHNLIIELYGDCARVDISVIYGGMDIQTQDKMNIRDYSMQRINGEWIEQR